MNQVLNDTAKKTGDSLIDMSAQLADKLDTWSNIVTGEGTLKNTERAGFVNKTSADSGIDLVIDVQAPNDSEDAVLRTWAIESYEKDDTTTLFNNIQLTFKVEYKKARSFTERFDSVTRDDIRSLLHETDTLLKSVVISNQSGVDKETQKTYGQRFDLSVNEIDGQAATDDICANLEAVLETLQRDAEVEAH